MGTERATPLPGQLVGSLGLSFSFSFFLSLLDFILMVLGIEPRALSMLGMGSTTPHHWPYHLSLAWLSWSCLAGCHYSVKVRAQKRFWRLLLSITCSACVHQTHSRCQPPWLELALQAGDTNFGLFSFAKVLIVFRHYLFQFYFYPRLCLWKCS